MNEEEFDKKIRQIIRKREEENKALKKLLIGLQSESEASSSSSSSSGKTNVKRKKRDK